MPCFSSSLKSSEGKKGAPQKEVSDRSLLRAIVRDTRLSISDCKANFSAFIARVPLRGEDQF